MQELIAILFKWLKPIVAVCAAAALVSAAIALMLPEKYTSTATFLTANPHLMDPGALFSTESGKNPVYLFGGKQDVERILSLAGSRRLQDYLIGKYSLYEHYDVDRDDPQGDYWVRDALNGHLKTVKTAKGALEVEVLDKNPAFAAQMANDVLHFIDSLNKAVVTEKKYDVLNLYDLKRKEKKASVSQLTDSLNQLIAMNPKDTVSQGVLSRMLKSTVAEYYDLELLYDRQYASIHNDYSTIYLLEPAVPAVKKSKPVRWLIVVSSTMLAFFAMCSFAVLLEKYRQYR